MKNHRINCILLAAASFLITGCVDFGPIDKASSHVEAAAKDLQEGMTALSKVDPLALNQLISTNENLRQRLETVKIQIQSLSAGTGTVVLQNHKVQFRIVQYSGSFRVTGWIDLTKNWFWQRKFDDKSIKLSIDCLKIIQDYRNDVNVSGGLLHEVVKADAQQNKMNDIAGIAKTYQTEIDKAFKKFLQNSALVPAPAESIIDLQSQFLRVGDHMINIEITPIKANEQNRWSLRGQIVSVDPNNQVEVIKEFDVDSDLNKQQFVGNPLPIVSAFVTVQTQ